LSPIIIGLVVISLYLVGSSSGPLGNSRPAATLCGGAYLSRRWKLRRPDGAAANFVEAPCRPHPVDVVPRSLSRPSGLMAPPLDFLSDPGIYRLRSFDCFTVLALSDTHQEHRRFGSECQGVAFIWSDDWRFRMPRLKLTARSAPYGLLALIQFPR